ncbi:MAG: sulfatase-like hydrolase/transferase [Planctomycetes bacterium]|nr:sulfatase-like hydrolase/transferase [Planctomycetota bacterium]
MRNINPISLVLLISCLASVLHGQNTQKPNFIIYMGDDLGYESFGCAGNDFAKTPHIDKLASDGVVFDRLYGTVSQCSPIRQELFTGLYPHNNGILANAVKNLKPGLKDIGDYLAPLGYALSVSGKVGCKIGKNFKKIKGVQGGANSFEDQFDLSNIKAFIQESKQTEKPFCVYIGSVHGHHPWNLGTPQKNGAERVPVPDHYVDTPVTRESLNKHAAEVTLFDEQFGEIVSMANELEITDNTILIVLSEHGIAMPRAKWSVYDKGNRSLGVIYWKGKIEAGRKNAIAQYCDILPTLVDYAGGKVPEGIDGFSLRPVIEGQSNIHRDFAYLANVHPTRQWAIVQDEWKLVWSPFQEDEHLYSNFTNKSKESSQKESYGGYTKMFAHAWSEWVQTAEEDSSAKAKIQHVLHPKEVELYKIDKDYNESKNLADNPEHSNLIEEMMGKLKSIVGNPSDTPARSNKKDKKLKKSKKKKKA